MFLKVCVVCVCFIGNVPKLVWSNKLKGLQVDPCSFIDVLRSDLIFFAVLCKLEIRVCFILICCWLFWSTCFNQWVED